MSFRRFVVPVLVLVLIPVVSACASPGGADSGGTREITARRGSSTLIVRAQLADLASQSAYDAILTLNRRWLLPRRGSSLSAGLTWARVVVDGVTRGEIILLAEYNTDNIETMRYLSAPNATTRYGTGFPGGVIEVTLKRYVTPRLPQTS